jgi:AcrR family transcriptional regulator
MRNKRSTCQWSSLMRADAARNRDRVLEAAELVLTLDGLDAPMRAIARQAGVGVGTVYRQYPTKEALYQAIMADRMERLVARASSLAGDIDAGRVDAGTAFCAYFESMVTDATTKKIFADALADAGIDAKAASGEAASGEAAGHDVPTAIETLLVRAQRSGAVRADARLPEVLGLLSGACLAAKQQHWDAELRGRTLGIIFDGLRG